MTTVHISLGRDDGTDQTAAKGVVEWEPTTRREDGTMVILERGFVAPLVDGEATVIVDPSGLTWCWRVTERTDSGGTERYVSVPDSAVVVEYVSLPDVDPTTLQPWAPASPEAAYLAAFETAVSNYLALNPISAPVTSVNGEVGAVSLALTHLTDVTIGDSTEGDVFTLGPEGMWGPATPPSGTLSGVSDGTLGTPQTGDAPVFNAVTGKWERVSLPSTYVAPTGTDDRLQVAGVDVTPAQVGAQPAGDCVIPALYLPGVAGNNVSCPDSAGVSVTGDLDVRVKLALTDWTPAANTVLAGKFGGSSDASWWLYLLATTGRPRLYWSGDGTSAASVNAAATIASLDIADATSAWIRATLDIETGAGASTVRFYRSTDGSTWTQLGDPVVVSGPAAIFDSAAALTIGYGNFMNGLGLFEEFQLYDGIDGTLVAAWDGSWPHTRQRDSAGNIWTVNGTANAWQAVTA